MKRLFIAIMMFFFLAGTALADVQVKLGWSPNNEPDLAGYNVYRSETDGGPYSFIGSVPAGTETYTDTTLGFENAYYWVVTAFDSETPRHESGYSNQASLTTPSNPSNGPPGSPRDVNVTVKVIVEILQ